VYVPASALAAAGGSTTTADAKMLPTHAMRKGSPAATTASTQSPPLRGMKRARTTPHAREDALQRSLRHEPRIHVLKHPKDPAQLPRVRLPVLARDDGDDFEQARDVLVLRARGRRGRFRVREAGVVRRDDRGVDAVQRL
jgi:hypothetical protein